MLVMLGLDYRTEKGRNFVEQLMDFISSKAFLSSALLAHEKGTFPKWNAELFLNGGYMKKMRGRKAWAETFKAIEKYGLRNAKIMSIAPTGTLSLTFGNNCSSGIEPIFSLEYERKIKFGGQSEKDVKIVKVRDFAYALWKNCGEPKKYKELFATAMEMTVEQHLLMLGKIAYFVDMSVSKTINIPTDYSFEDTQQIYLKAHDLGIKGTTIFRPNELRPGILITSDTKKEEENKPVLQPSYSSFNPQRGEVIAVSDDLVGKKRKIMSGCVDKDTEYFNGKEWKKISEYQEGEQVLQYNSDGTAELVQPLAYIKNPTQGFYHFKTKYGLDMMVSKEHRNVVFTKGGKYKILTTEELLNIHNKNIAGFTDRFKLAFNYDGKGIDLTDDEIRISVAIFADGCFYSDTSKKCVVSVTKERKYNRLVKLLERAGIEYTVRYDDQSYYHIKFYPPIPGKVKTFPTEWYNCSKHQMEVILDEVFNWDGYAKEKNEYTTVIKSNADFIQFACASLGMRGSIYTDMRHDRICYRVDWSERIYTTIAERPKKEIPFVPSEDGYEYCFSVPSTMLVLRRNNKIFITGNCGSLHIMAYFDSYTGELREVYLSRGSEGGCASFMNGLSRMISVAARAGVAIGDIVDQLNSCTTCPSYAVRKATKHDTSKGNCCPGAVANALKEMWQEMKEEVMDRQEEIVVPELPTLKVEKPRRMENKTNITSTTKCPECGEPVDHIGGCVTCPSCGWSKCG
jgi:co-chaperonin GroES (HSP10)